MSEHKHVLPIEAPRWVDIIDAIRNGVPAEDGTPTNWRTMLGERGVKELGFAKVYAEQFAHGTTGHNQLIIINELCTVVDFLLDNYTLTPKG